MVLRSGTSFLPSAAGAGVSSPGVTGQTDVFCPQLFVTSHWCYFPLNSSAGTRSRSGSVSGSIHSPPQQQQNHRQENKQKKTKIHFSFLLLLLLLLNPCEQQVPLAPDPPAGTGSTPRDGRGSGALVGQCAALGSVCVFVWPLVTTVETCSRQGRLAPRHRSHTHTRVFFSLFRSACRSSPQCAVRCGTTRRERHSTARQPCVTAKHERLFGSSQQPRAARWWWWRESERFVNFPQSQQNRNRAQVRARQAAAWSSPPGGSGRRK